MGYQAFDLLQQQRATLHDSLVLDSGVQLAAWSNRHNLITQQPDHHTLSLYVADGLECYYKGREGWRNGGGPDRFCLMPKDSESTWDVRGELSFVHLYCTHQHLLALAERTWDKSPARIDLAPQIFGDDPQITLLYRQFLLAQQWQDPANRLALSSASTLLLTHLLRRYSQLQWQLPRVKGGLAPVVLSRVKAYMEQHLDQPIKLQDLAGEAGLSEYHFARMFKQSTGQAPHQYLMARRLARAQQLLRHSEQPLVDIALACGFSSASHFSNRFKAATGLAPSALRRQPG
ncbi:AraC family transcriptional regulator [Gallaecimonas xiamenensis]|nr:AraC family transcriptional regulator [Gallaecimonas xiamenensis]